MDFVCFLVVLGVYLAVMWEKVTNQRVVLLALAEPSTLPYSLQCSINLPDHIIDSNPSCVETGTHVFAVYINDTIYTSEAQPSS